MKSNIVKTTDAIDLDKVRYFLDNPDAPELSEKEKTYLDRMYFAFNLLRANAPRVVKERLKKHFTISDTTAHRCIKDAQSLLGSMNKFTTEFLEHFIIEDAITQRNYCKSIGDQKGWNLASNILVDMYKLMRTKQDGIPPEQLGGNTYYTVMNFGNGQLEKIDMQKINSLPANKRMDLATANIFDEIDLITAEEIMKS